MRELSYFFQNTISSIGSSCHFMNVSSIWIWRVMIPFVCKIQNHAHIMGELSYILLKTISLQFILYPSIWYLNSYPVCFCKTKLFFLVLCAIIKSVEGLVYLLEPCSLLWVGYLIPCFKVCHFEWDKSLSICFIIIFYAH